MTASQGVPRLGADAPPEDIRAQLVQSGCVIVEGLTPAAQMDAIEKEIAPLLEKTPPGQGIFVGLNTKRVNGLVAKSPSTHVLALQASILRTMSLTLTQCERFQLHITQAIAVLPGEIAQVLHRDRGMYPYCPAAIEPMVNVMWALTKFTRENGGTHVVPGSHLWSATNAQRDIEPVAAEMQPGSALLYLGSTVHGAGANNSNEPRIGVVMGYNLGWLRQYENQYLAVPLDVARNLPPELASLIGYAAHRPNLGLFECRDPMDLLPLQGSADISADDVLSPEMDRILSGFLKPSDGRAAA
ncbi:MAG: phytanoyl-CoA dioxygenase family protein [Alphaproteobacteria bacterium]|nr:phytanoyl-CoA dioxygenase family protein [Alphaproteobacteria bacterium]